MTKQTIKQCHEEFLQEQFNRLNLEKFNNKLPRYTIKTKDMKRNLGKVYFYNKTILINPNYNLDSQLNTLLHELTHAYIYNCGGKSGHTVKFWRTFISKGGKITDINKQHYKKAILVSEEKLK
jgi:predicted SprT family Zn-dependent metalloprotease